MLGKLVNLLVTDSECIDAEAGPLSKFILIEKIINNCILSINKHKYQILIIKKW